MSVRIDENTDHMKYTDDMEAIDSDIMDRVIAEMNSYDADIYTAEDVKEALAAETCSVDNFKALLSPAALPFLEEISTTILRGDRTESTERDKKTFWKFCSNLYSIIYSKLL